MNCDLDKALDRQSNRELEPQSPYSTSSTSSTETAPLPNESPTNCHTDRAFGGTLLVKTFIIHYSLPTPPLQTIEATIVIQTAFDHDPISIVFISRQTRQHRSKHLTATVVGAAHIHASRPIETQHKSYTPPYIHKLMKQKNQYRDSYHRTLDPHYKTIYNKAQRNVKKELRNYNNENWTTRLKALSTQDNSLWALQKFLKNKRSDIPALNCSTGTAVTDDQKANILADFILTLLKIQDPMITMTMKMN
ncbi:hypothetical protein TNCV_1334131 [Trichonephila clavipes]|nr:hypothetical protein TNCV_1334131 [Trichonephila clavipes]